MNARASLIVSLAAGAAFAAFGSTSACTSSSDGATSGTSGASGTSGTCPDDLPAACPAVAPSYAKEVAPAIQQACTPCHAPGGEQASRSLVTYAGAFANRSAMLNQVHACRMPPAGAPPISEDGRKLLQTWVVCGAPNN